MEIQLKTILAILYANDMENIVSKAVQIDTGFNPTESDVKSLRVETNRDNLPEGKQFLGGKSYGCIDCPVIGFNQYKLREQYLIQYPNGNTAWKSGNDRGSLVEVIDIPTP